MPMRGLHDNIVSKKYKNVKKENAFFPFIFSLILIQPLGCPHIFLLLLNLPHLPDFIQNNYKEAPLII